MVNVLEVVVAGAEMVCNDLDCPLMLLTKRLACVSPSQILCPVSVVHECTETCEFREVLSSRTVEREQIQAIKTEFFHDWNNDMFCLNI